MRTRAATEQDLPAITAIYAHEAATGIATFDTDPRTLDQWRARLASTEVGDHLLVGSDREGSVVAYAHSSAYRPKDGYRHTRESSVYVAPGSQGLGLGRELYDDLLARLAADGVHLVVAAVALPNPASLALHRACGFEEVGVMREVGRKFDRWIDVAWLQRLLAAEPLR